MSNIKLKAPNKVSLTKTGIIGGTAGAGFLVSRAGHNFLPGFGAPTTKNKAIIGGVILAALALHSSVKGTDSASDAVRGLTLGVAMHNVGKLTNMMGETIPPEAPNAEGVRGLRAPSIGKAFLCEHYPMKGVGARGVRGLKEIISEAKLLPADEFVYPGETGSEAASQFLGTSQIASQMV